MKMQESRDQRVSLVKGRNRGINSAAAFDVHAHKKRNQQTKQAKRETLQYLDDCSDRAVYPKTMNSAAHSINIVIQGEDRDDLACLQGRRAAQKSKPKRRKQRKQHRRTAQSSPD